MVEADSIYREHGTYGGYAHRPILLQPICFARQYNLRQEIEENLRREGQEAEWAVRNSYMPDGEDVLAVTQRDRGDCPGYTPWQQGFTPKEHREKLDREKMLQWQKQRDEDDRAWREKQRRDERRWRVIELIVIGGISVLVAGGFTVLGAFIERGSWP